MSKYIPTIGIETHVQLKTKTKLFSGVGNDASDAKPNTLISHIDVAMPGALPVLNEKALELATRAAFALNTRPQKHSYFERKHYFYPDSPAGYQISQMHAPIIVGGSVEIEVGGHKKTIRINRAQLEADAGKNTHPTGSDFTLVDLSRAGTPLLEIVSEPDIHSGQEAKAYVRELYLLMKYADISDCDLYLGHMRFDVNVSISDDPKKLGIRSEVKNLNSFRSVEAAINYEIQRQTEILDKGEQIEQETRGWDEDAQKTTSQRTKEQAHDYRYMPEPDIPPIELSEDYISGVQATMADTPNIVRDKLKSLVVEAAVIEDLLDRPLALNKILEILEQGGANEARRIAFWLISSSVDDKIPNSTNLIELSKMTEEGKLSSSAAKQVYQAMLKDGSSPEKIAQDLHMLQESDEGIIEKIVDEVLAENPKAAEDIKNGEMKAIGFLVGQVMAKSKGRANPGLAQNIIKQKLS